MTERSLDGRVGSTSSENLIEWKGLVIARLVTAFVGLLAIGLIAWAIEGGVELVGHDALLAKAAAIVVGIAAVIWATTKLFR